MFFEINCSYYPYFIYKKNYDLCLKSKTENKHMAKL